MEVEKYLNKIVEDEGTVHLTLIDPASQTPEEAGHIAHEAVSGGTDAIMVGGSTGAGGTILDQTIEQIKQKVAKPVILFPGNVDGISPKADAIFFMSLLNSRDVNFVATNQMIGAPLVYKYGIEAISMAYLIVEPGGTVGWVGDAKLIPKNKPELSVAYSLAGKYLGMHYTYLEAGSGASEPIKPRMIAATKKALGSSNKLIVGGGIRSPSDSGKCAEAGADMIVTGTIVEETNDIKSKVEEIIKAIKQ
ncbi:geranylgeranylglyceryl/heptaprenylglyceryl phosphate synthase [Methanosalsum natronophilum]|uniref:Geranylgeranylglyceryl phosphate synthase n=1 Tax=Methanosalsum natronophilum TaxID=768733 RepID=A0A424Z1Z5_9EURY|nr:MAG: geranylgeranylglyceryl/heptaprenylglyceryl phosphate synthase [Methanosalsum natronophilum]